jgi:hypothetical protein
MAERKKIETMHDLLVEVADDIDSLLIESNDKDWEGSHDDKRRDEIAEKLRRLAARLEEEPLFVLPHDGTLGGDNTFYPPEYVIPYVEGMTLKSYRKALLVYLRGRSEQDVDSVEFPEEIVAEVKGAWVVNQSTIDIMASMDDAQSHLPPGNDCVCYALNHSRKTMLNNSAKKFIGRKPK